MSVPASLLDGPPQAAWVKIAEQWQPTPLQAHALGQGRGLPRWWFCQTTAPANAPIIISDKSPEVPTPESKASVAAAAATGASLETLAQGGVALVNEHLRLELDPNHPGVIRQLIVHGHAVTASLPWEATYDTSGVHYSSHHPSPCKLEVIEQGPARVVVEIAGSHQPSSAGMNSGDSGGSGSSGGSGGSGGLEYRLRLEVVAGLPALVMRYWFFHQLPHVAELELQRMQLHWSFDAPQGRHAFVQLKHGLTAIARTVLTNHPLRAAVGHDGACHLRMTTPEALEDDTHYPPYQMPPVDEVGPWVATRLAHHWAVVAMDDMADMQPKAMTLDRGRFTLDIWPDWAAPLSLPQGRSRSITLRLAFLETETAPGQDQAPDRQHIAALLEATGQRGPQLLSPARYAQAAVFDQQWLLPNDHTHERFDSYLAKVACPPTVADMFDLGDTPDPGYQTTYLRTGRRLTHIAPPSARRPVQFLTGVRQAIAPWSDHTQFEPIWANNEYDVIWCMGSEIMRAGKADLLQSLRWFARHAIEVDFVHHSDDPIKHRTTPPHCARHTTAGAYPSHFWTEGVLQYYALTGDRDALSFAQGIGDKIVQFFTTPDTRAKLWHPTRELGWALLALAALVEFDPKPQYIDMANEIAADLIKAPLTDAFIAQAVRYAFGFSSIVLGLDKWHGITGDENIKRWLVDFARACGPHMDVTPGVELAMGLCILHAGYKHSQDASLVRCGMRTLERIIDSRVWVDPQPYTKPLALLYRPLARFFGDASRQGDLARLDYRF